MSIGLIGVALSLVLGIVLGGISGYYGGRIDYVIQRVIEFILSMPTIPLWIGLAAAMPPNWPPLAGLFLHHHHPLADRLDQPGARGARPLPVAAQRGFRDRRAARRRAASRASSSATWCPPSSATSSPRSRLAIPRHDPGRDGAAASSASACSRRSSAGACCCRRRRTSARSPRRPGCSRPGVAVVVAVLALNFLGDGLRDAADPYDQ